MKVLIIGGTGLISTPMTRMLADRGDSVTVCNRAKRRQDLPVGVKQIIADRTAHQDFEAQMRASGIYDAVIDMVCYQPEDAASLCRAFAGRAGQVIVCSTVDVYAKPAARYPITEAEPHRPPPWDYALNKAVCERTLQEAHARGDFPVTIIRPGHTYHHGGALLHSFGSSTTYLDRLRKGKPIVVHGDGMSLWASCHAKDVAAAFVAAAGNLATHGQSYHTAGDEWMTWNRMHEMVAEALGAPPPTMVHIPTDLLAAVAKRAFISAVNFRYNNIFDNSAARRDLGFRQTVPFAEGAKRTVEWLEANGKIQNSDDDSYDDRVIAAWERSQTALSESFDGGNC